MGHESCLIDGNDRKCEETNIPFKTILGIFILQCLINFFILIFFNNYSENLLFLENNFFYKKKYVLKIYHLKKNWHIFSYFLYTQF